MGRNEIDPRNDRGGNPHSWSKIERAGTLHNYTQLDQQMGQFYEFFYQEARMQLMDFLRQRGWGIEDMAARRALPMGITEHGGVLTVEPRQNILLITDPREGVGREVLMNIALGSQMLQSPGAQSLHVIDNSGGSLWEPYRREVHNPLSNPYRTRTLGQGGSDQIVRSVLESRGIRPRVPATDMVNLVADVVDKHGGDLARGYVFDPYAQQGRDGHMVGSDTVTVLDRLPPRHLADSSMSDALQFLFAQFRRTPIARAIMHLSLPDVLKGGRQSSRVGRQIIDGNLLPVLSDAAVGRHKDIEDALGVSMGEFNEARERLENSPPPQYEGFHVPTDTRVERVVPFDPS